MCLLGVTLPPKPRSACPFRSPIHEQAAATGAIFSD
jgi:hypothetical protein